MSRGLRSTCGFYDDAAIYYDGNDRMFYAGDTFDRCDVLCSAQATSSDTYASLSANKTLSGTVSANVCSIDSLCNAVDTVASNSVSISSSFDELAARISALESVIDKEVNDCKNSFSNAVAGIKRLARTGLKTLQYGAR